MKLLPENFSLMHDVGSFRLRYLLHPPTGRGKADIALSLLTAMLLIVAWVIVLTHYNSDTATLATILTAATLFILGSACREVKSIQKNLRQVPIDFTTKVRYARCTRAQAVAMAGLSVGCVVADTWKISELALIGIISVFAAAMAAMPYLFRVKQPSGPSAGEIFTDMMP